jgi:uncharacterized protein
MLRRHLLAGLGATAGTVLAGSAYALAIEPGFRLEVRHYRPTLPAWPAGFRLRIAVIADLHAGGPNMLPRRVEGIVDAVEGLRPDLALFLGDLTASHRFLTERVPPARSAAILSRLRPPLGLHAVLGNHDWWDDPATFRIGRRHRPDIERVLLAAGIPVLENGAVRLRHGGRGFWLAGLGSMWAFGGRIGRWRGIDDLPATLAALTDDAPAILLAHEPDIFPRVPARVALTLSGHTHGGQVRLPGVGLRVPSNYGDRYAHGHIVEDGRHLIVSAGLGTSGYPVRFGVPPEIVLVELGTQAAGAG